MHFIVTQAVVIGGGSGGFGAAYSLAKQGIRTILIDKNPGLGGTSVFGGVNCYEPGICWGTVHRLLAQELAKHPQACSVCKTVPNAQLLSPESVENNMERYPWGLSVSDPNETYDSTLKRCISLTRGDRNVWRRFQFEPFQMEQAMRTLLDPYQEHLTLLLDTTFLDCTADGSRITQIRVQNKKNELMTIGADYFIDATGDIVLARDADCTVTIGAEGKDVYQEPGAGDPEEINGVTYVFRIGKKKHEAPTSQSDGGNKKYVPSCFNCYPNQDINVNMLPTMTGKEYLSAGHDADRQGRAVVLAYWDWLQREKGLDDYELQYLFPQPGIRESYRLVGRYVLTEHDIRAGINHQPLQQELIAIADHALDTHDKKSECRELQAPYGIPLSCLRPKEYDNLFVACRGASFSHIAASSARLSRTMLSLGEAAGNAVSMLIQEGTISLIKLQEIMKQ